MTDFTNLGSIIDLLFSSFDTSIFGSVTVMVLFIIFIVFALLMFFSANRFTVGGFMASFMLALGYYGYTAIGYIAPLGLLIAGAIMFIALMRIFNQ